jgi:V8-like Glu-specific endopeptidase
VRGEGEAFLTEFLARQRASSRAAPPISARAASYGLSKAPNSRATSGGDPSNGSLAQIPNTEPAPYRQVCLLEITPHSDDGQPLQGSGWLATPNLVVTAGHCVFQRNLNSYALNIRVHLAVNGTGQEHYDTQDSHNLQSVKEWTHDGDLDADIGAIILPNAFVGPPGHFGYDNILSDADLEYLLVDILGYPDSKFSPDSLTMWGNEGLLSRPTPTRIFYGMQTVDGMSGGPVFYTDGNGRHIVGIHNYGDGEYGNFATRLTESVQNVIIGWAAKAKAVLGSS